MVAEEVVMRGITMRLVRCMTAVSKVTLSNGLRDTLAVAQESEQNEKMRWERDGIIGLCLAEALISFTQRLSGRIEL
jgi:hypothetical protein